MTDRIQEFCGDHWWKVAGAGVAGKMFTVGVSALKEDHQNVLKLKNLLSEAKTQSIELRKLINLQGDYLKNAPHLDEFFRLLQSSVTDDMLLTSLKGLHALDPASYNTVDYPDISPVVEKSARNLNKGGTEAELISTLKTKEKKFLYTIRKIGSLFDSHYLNIENGKIVSIKDRYVDGRAFRLDFVKKIAEVIGTHHIVQGGPELNFWRDICGSAGDNKTIPNGWEKRVDIIKKLYKLSAQELTELQKRNKVGFGLALLFKGLVWAGVAMGSYSLYKLNSE